MFSCQHLCIKYLRLFCRKYRLFLILVLIILIFQGFSGYYIYSGVDNILRGLQQKSKHTDSSAVPLYEDNFEKYIEKKSLLFVELPSNDGSSLFNRTSIDIHGKVVSTDTGDDVQTLASGFSLPCDVQSKEAKSALQRAKTLECRKEIANISCQVQKGSFFPSRLVNLCPSLGHVRGKYMGCYIDDRQSRVLNGHMTQLKINSPSICADHCLQRGYIYSGVQYSKECFCGNKELPLHQRVPDSECDMTCAGDLQKKVRCGGYLRINVFETGLAKISPHALKRPSAKEGPPVHIAYILTVNGRALRQVQRLIKALYHRDHYFFIHVDQRHQYLHNELLLLEESYPNILLSRKRFSSIWGGASLLSVLLHCMTELLKMKNWRWDFVINLSESDFPIKTNRALVQFLTANRDRNFLKSHGQDTNKFLQKQGLDRTFLECETHMWRIGQRKLPLGIRMDGGSDWVCLNRQFVTYVTESRDQLVTGLLRFFSYTLLPGESFFHTVLRNSEFCQSFTDNNLHVTNWKRKLGCRCQYKHIVDWCGCSPNDFTPDDWPKIQASKNRNLFFGRKFEAAVSLTTINLVDEWLYGKYSPATPGLNSYWENRYHFEDSPIISDDVGLTLYNSVMRMTRAAFKTSNQTQKFLPDEAIRASVFGYYCDIVPITLLEVFSYHQNDTFQGLLVNFVAVSQNSRGSFKLQSWIRPKYMSNLSPSRERSQLLKKIEVNSNFDQKEQVFRNFGKCLGPRSTLVAVTWWQSFPDKEVAEESVPESEGGNVIYPKIILIDSVGAFAAEAQLTVHVGHKQVLDHTFTLNSPLRPGIWTAYVVVENELLASEDFAILPLQFSQGRQLSIAEGRVLHSGPEEPYSDTSLNSSIKLPKIAEPFPGNDAYLRVAEQNAKKYGHELLQWIDQVVSRAYSLIGVCHVASETLPSCIQQLTIPCPQAAWSSHSLDPKCHLGEIDPKTGRIRDVQRVAREL